MQQKSHDSNLTSKSATAKKAVHILLGFISDFELAFIHKIAHTLYLFRNRYSPFLSCMQTDEFNMLLYMNHISIFLLLQMQWVRERERERFL